MDHIYSLQALPSWNRFLLVIYEVSGLFSIGCVFVGACVEGCISDLKNLLSLKDEDSLCNKLCTFTITQKEFMNQHWYEQLFLLGGASQAVDFGASGLIAWFSFLLGTTVTLAKWSTGWVCAQCAPKCATRTTRFPMPNMGPSSVTVEPKKMAAVW